MPRSRSDGGRWFRESGLAAFACALPLLAALGWLLARQSGVGAGATTAAAGFPYALAMGWLERALAGGWTLPLGPAQMLAVAADALFLSLLWRDVARFAGRAWASAMALLVALNPLFLLSIDGGSHALTLLTFYMLCRSLRRLYGAVEPFTYLRIGAALAALLCIDLPALLLAVALAPWLLLVMPADVRRRAPAAFYLVCYLPALFLLGMWAYLVLTVFDGAWPSLAQLAGDGVALPAAFGAQPLLAQWPALLRWPLAALACCPVLLLATLTRSPVMTRGVLAALASVVTAALLALLAGHAFDDLLVLLWVPVALLLKYLRGTQRWLAAVLLLAGCVGAGMSYPALLGQAGLGRGAAAGACVGAAQACPDAR